MGNLLGVVMSGGQSRRMGTDKGLIPYMDTYWAVHVANKLTTAGLPVVVSINDTQQEKYRVIFPSQELIVDYVDVNGPLRGLLSVHAIYPQKDLLLLACDMIEMETGTLKNLINIYQT